MLLTKLGVKIKMTKSMEEIVDSKFKFLEKYLERNTHVKFTCFKENSIILNLSIMFVYRNKLIKASISNDDFYIGLDKLVDKIKTQLVKNKEITSKHTYKKDLCKLDDTDNSTSDVSDIEKKIVKRKEFTMKPMYEEEAILQMEHLNHNSFMFLNAKTETMCLVYKRKDGNFGLIQGLSIN